MLRKYPLISYAFVLLLVFMTVLTIVVGANYSVTSKVFDGEMRYFETGWQTPSGEVVAVPGKVSPDADGRYIVSATLPEGSDNEGVVCIYTNHQQLEARINGELAYSWRDVQIISDFDLGLPYCIIPIPAGGAGTLIEIEFFPTSTQFQPEINSISLGSGIAAVASIFSNGVGPYTLSIVMIAFTLLLAISAFALYRRTSHRNMRNILYLSLFIATSSVWIISDNDASILLLRNLSSLHVSSFYSFMLMPVTFLLFLSTRFDYGRRTLYAASIVGMLNIVVCSLLMLFGVKSLPQTLISTHIYLVITVLMTSYIAVIEYRKTRNSESLEVLIGACVLCFTCIVALALYYMYSGISNTGVFQVGFFAFICTISIGTLGRGLKLFMSTKELQTRADSDSLTNLLNHAATEQRVNAYLFTEGAGLQHALMIIDIDNFKLVNDLFGHYEGDRMLIKLATEIRSLFRSSDIVGRIGGDEFIAFLKNVPSENLVRLKAGELCEMLQFEQRSETQSLAISCSVGITMTGETRKDFAELYKEADIALYKAKESGKNRYVLYGDSDEHKIVKAKASSDRQPIGNVNIQLRALLKHMDGGVLLLEVGDTVRPIYASPGYFIMNGIEDTMLSVNNIIDLIHKDDAAAFEDAMRDSAESGRVSDLVYRSTVRPDVPINWRHIRAVRIPFEESSLPVLIAVVTDVNHLKQQEQALRESEASLKLALNQTDLRIWEYDHSTNVIDGPKLDFPLSDLPESAILSGHIHPDSADEFRAFIAGIRAMDKFGSCVLRIRPSAGVYEWFRLSFRSMFDENAMEYKTVGITEPVPYIAKAKQQLLEQDELYKVVSDTVLAAFKVNLTNDTVISHKGIIECTDSSYLVLLNKVLLEHTYMSESISRFAPEQMLKAYEQGYTRVEVERPGKPEHPKYLNLIAELLPDPANGDIFAFIYVRDISWRKQLEVNCSAPIGIDVASSMYTREYAAFLIGEALRSSKNELCAFVIIELRTANDVYSIEDETVSAAYTQISKMLEILLDSACIVFSTERGRIGVFSPSVSGKDFVVDTASELSRHMRAKLDALDSGEHIYISIGAAIAECSKVDFSEIYDRAARAIEGNKALRFADSVSIYEEDTHAEQQGGFDLTSGEGELSEIEASSLVKALDSRTLNVIVPCLSALLLHESVDEAVEEIFINLSAYYRADRLYTLMINPDGQTVRCVHEWHGSYNSPVYKLLQNTPISRLPVIARTLTSGHVVFLHQPRRESHPNLLGRGSTQLDNAWNFICVPIILSEQIQGFVCIENPRENADNASIITALIPFIASRSLKSEEQISEYIAKKAIPQAAQFSRTARASIALDSAISKGRIRVFFQPRLAADSGDLIGAMAAPYYRDEHGAMADAEHLVPLLENEERVRELDYLLLDSTMRQMQKYDLHGVDVCVRVSRATLANPNSLAAILAIWTRYDVPMSQLTLLVRGGAIPEKWVVPTCEKLRDSGFNVSMNDDIPPGEDLPSPMSAQKFHDAFIK